MLLHLCVLLFLVPAAQPTPEQEIRAVLDRQVQDWNRGDVRAFMDGYEKSEDLTFVGKTLTRGHAKVLENYLRNYSSKEKMGRLEFFIEEVSMLGNGHASVIGRWKLIRTADAGGDAGGIYTLVFRKGAAGWRIILDHTS